MENPEIEILLIEDDPREAETIKDIFQENSITSNKILHLKDSAEADDFIFCKGRFSNRNIFNQPKTIVLNTRQMKAADVKFLNKIDSMEYTKNIAVVAIASKNGMLAQSITDQKPERKLLPGLYDLTNI